MADKNMLADLQVTQVPPCECMTKIEPVVAGSPSQLLAWYTDLRSSPGWRHYMRRLHNDAVAAKRRWDKPRLTAEELEERNKDVTTALAVLDLVQRLDREIAELTKQLRNGGE